MAGLGVPRRHVARCRDVAHHARQVAVRCRHNAHIDGDGRGAADGPIGAMGVPLTPGRSLAVDPAFVPYGTPVWLDTVYSPGDPLAPARPLRRLLIAQDTGTAIKGAVRGDVFWGHGPEAAARAGVMKSPGRWYLLLPH